MPTTFQLCAIAPPLFKNDLPLIIEYVITLLVKRGTVLFMYGIFSKEVLSKDVTLNTASLPSLNFMPHAVVSLIFLYVTPSGELTF